MELKYKCCLAMHFDVIKDWIDNFGLDVTKIPNIFEYSLKHRSYLLASYLYLNHGLSNPDVRHFILFISNLDKFNLLGEKDLLLEFAHKDPCYSRDCLQDVATKNGIWDQVVQIIDELVKEPDNN
jgi:hypothetical protein